MKDPEPRPYTLTIYSSAVRRCRSIARTALPAAALALTPLLTLAQDLPTSAIDPVPSDQNALLLLSVFVIGALLISFMCALAESVLLNISPAYIAELNKSRSKQAQLLQKIRGEHLNRSLIALLGLNTLALMVGASVAGAQSMRMTDHIGLSITVAILCALFLFIAGILPKTLGAVHWRTLAIPVVVLLNLLNKALFPFIVIAESFSHMISRGRDVKVFNRDEFIAMANIGTQAGQINERESRIIRNLLHFGSLRAHDVMTPRTVVASLPESMPIEHALQFRMTAPFSRIPVYDEDLDAVTGFVLREDMLVAQTRGTGHRPIAELRREIVAVAATTTLSNLLELFLNRRQQIAIVVGEYGETKGLVTMEDVIETLLGIEILDEGDKIEDMQELARKLWRKRAESLGLDQTQRARADHGAVLQQAQPSQKRNRRLDLAGATARS